MFLLIDVGNTDIHVALATHDQITKHHHRVPTSEFVSVDVPHLSEMHFLEWLESIHVDKSKIEHIAIASVAPEANEHLGAALQSFSANPFWITHETPSPLQVNIDQPDTLGADRIANAVAAHNRFPDDDVIVLDFGTATTFDVIFHEGSYEGGIISPGLQASLSTLTNKASLLPEIDFNPTEYVVGKNTKDCLQSGFFFGYIAMIQGLIEKISAEQKRKFHVISTGGLGNVFKDHIAQIRDHDPDLTLKGIQDLYHYNTSFNA
jgi:type III pantothenate kinase